MRACARRRESLFLAGNKDFAPKPTPPALNRSVSSGMVEYVGVLKIRVIHASGLGSMEAICAAQVGTQKLKTSASKKSHGTARWDQVRRE